MPQSPGVLNIALSYALGPGDNEQTRIETAYLRLCQPICDWLRERGLDAGVGAVAGSFCDGRYNVTLDGRKLAGTAQRWRRNGAGRPVVLAHAALLRWSRWSTPSPAVAPVPRIARRTAISA
ncbi:Lipoate-protein ligase A [Pseudomonas aeruginosa]|nr:Lipoate-protein ligase A [Pseudomonas aeruginosa]